MTTSLRDWLRDFWHDVFACNSGYGSYDPATRESRCAFCDHLYNASRHAHRATAERDE